MSLARQKFGEPHEMARKKVFAFMPEMVQDFVRQAPFAVLATANAEGDCDASPKGGQPGFVKVIDERHLLVPDIAGNKLFQSYENVESNRKAGLVFLIPGCDWTVRVNGRVSVVDKQDGRLTDVDPEVFAPDENTRVQQGLLLEVTEAYAHCPRAFTFSKLWDVEQIAETREQEPNRYWLQRFMDSIEMGKA
jgi:predicted pyridoxine 5'-phosphate oxidase superfamily flavin-nucleotide-binding protein